MKEREIDPNWIDDDEKFALIGLDIQIDDDLGRVDLPGGLMVLPYAAFELPDHWEEWLGTMRVEDVQRASLFLVAKMTSARPGILDAENQTLQARVSHWLMGLILERNFVTYDEPFAASGARVGGEIDVRSFGSLDRPARTIVMDERPITADQLKRAAQIGERLATFSGPWRNGDWRLLRCLEIFRRARNDNDILHRIHQFTRCIEGLILPRQGETKRQFKGRTELFVGPCHHDLMGELYDVRSAVEHLHEYKYLEARDWPTRVRLAQLEAIAEFVARSCLARIVLDPALAENFGDVVTLADFWSKSDAERRAWWGAPIDPEAPLEGFDFDHVSDDELGVQE